MKIRGSKEGGRGREKREMKRKRED